MIQASISSAQTQCNTIPIPWPHRAVCFSSSSQGSYNTLLTPGLSLSLGHLFPFLSDRAGYGALTFLGQPLPIPVLGDRNQPNFLAPWCLYPFLRMCLYGFRCMCVPVLREASVPMSAVVLEVLYTVVFQRQDLSLAKKLIK